MRKSANRKPTTNPDFLDEVVKETRSAVYGLLTDADRHRFRAETIVLVDDPIHEIVTYAANHGVNLIVMGTHGRTSVAHLVLGSVAERVVRAAPCPVLTMR